MAASAEACGKAIEAIASAEAIFAGGGVEGLIVPVKMTLDADLGRMTREPEVIPSQKSASGKFGPSSLGGMNYYGCR